MNVKNKSGSTLLIVMSLMLVLMSISSAMLYAANNHYQLAQRQLDLEKAFFVAEAGVENAIDQIDRQRFLLLGTTTASGTVGGNAYNYVITQLSRGIYSVVSAGTVNGVGRVISINQVSLQTFAKFALWSAQNGKIYFIPGEQFSGPVHANDKMWFSSDESNGGSMFWDRCSSGASEYGGNNDYVYYEDGFHLNEEQGQMSEVDFSELKGFAVSEGLVLSGDTKIELKSDKMSISNDDRAWSDYELPIQADQLVYVENGNLTLDGGVLDGRLSLVSEKDIVINNHTVYQQNPTNASSDDALGLISKDDVWISTSAPDNLRLHAAIMATGKVSNDRGSFGVLSYQSGSPRGALNIMGSIVQDRRGAVGTFNSAGPFSGYFKNYTFDQRFQFKAPPYYPPLTSAVRYLGWSER